MFILFVFVRGLTAFVRSTGTVARAARQSLAALLPRRCASLAALVMAALSC